MVAESLVVAEAKRARGHSEHRRGPVGDGMDSMRAAHFCRRVFRRSVRVDPKLTPSYDVAPIHTKGPPLESVPQPGGLGIREFVGDVNRCAEAFSGGRFLID